MQRVTLDMILYYGDHYTDRTVTHYNSRSSWQEQELTWIDSEILLGVHDSLIIDRELTNEVWATYVDTLNL